MPPGIDVRAGCAGWQRQAEPAELAAGAHAYAETIGKLSLAAATQILDA
jgi:hypothetical protein